jgi:hypothetical protein
MEHEATARDSPNRQGMSIFIDTNLLDCLESERAKEGNPGKHADSKIGGL